MIPYIEFTSFSVGPLTIQVWGLFVALGITVGAWVSLKMAEHRGQDPKLILDLATWVIVAAMIGARVVYYVYEPGALLADPLEFFRVWHGGMSVMGGFLGAVIAGVIFLRKRHVDVWAHADTAIFGLPVGLFIGRIGCFLIHDHPGTLSDFALAVQYPEGARHDHGLYLSLNGLILVVIFLIMFKKKVQIGAYIVVFLIWYGLVRFFLDFYRATDGVIVDTRYVGLTPAQYFSLVMAGAGIWLYFKKLSKKV
ncbi:MAG: prolipoprotein diacylglyceryl transferase [bacterium]|jgi:phosphatidylglycerol---prolipoprotein diacylglyceryl transferase|nr:prolipoprotein diacylglyceryl transferase [bacterium]